MQTSPHDAMQIAKPRLKLTSILSFLMLCFCFSNANANPKDIYQFSDYPTSRTLKHPEWFKQSFLNLQEDLAEAKSMGKIGVVIYFGQNNCAYCEKLLKHDFGRQDIADYTQKYFDVVYVDIWGKIEITTVDGKKITERAFADTEKVHFTPTLLFYNLKGEKIFQLRGYYPPYQFRAALDYVVGEYYQIETFKSYVNRAVPGLGFEAGELNEHDIFNNASLNLNQKRHRPLAVFFEQARCHACDILHGDPLYSPEILQQLEKMDAVQLNLWAKTPIITPQGETTTAKAWADQLNIFYTPSILFFDENGNEIIRIDSTVQLYRLSKILRYVLTGAYKQHPNYQRWHAQDQ